MEKKLSRLSSDNYERPKQTIQEKMTDAEIKEKFKNYIKVDAIMNVDIGTHVRYFANIDGEMKYRSGGNIIKNIPWEGSLYCRMVSLPGHQAHRIVFIIKN